jgi:hypothetical protein
VTLLAVKLLLAPCFVVGASLTARRHGPRVGGLVGALPVVAGPILLIYALAHGRAFAAHAAGGTLLGLISLTAFVVVYARLAGRVAWPLGLLAGWLAFALGALLFSALAIPIGPALALACAAFALGLALLPRPGAAPAPALAPPVWDLPLRAACALALVLALTTVAGWLGPQLSGLLAPFPIIASVLATFTHTQRGVDETLRMLRGLLSGFGAYALFCFALALSLPDLDVAGAFALASGVALLAQSVMLRRALREPALVVATPAHATVRAGASPQSCSRR